MSCWACSPTCDRCKPKFYDCPCGQRGLIALKKCLACGRAMDEEDKRRGREAWERARASRTTD